MDKYTQPDELGRVMVDVPPRCPWCSSLDINHSANYPRMWQCYTCGNLWTHQTAN